MTRRERARRISGRRGVTLLELLIAAAVGTVIMGAVIGVYVHGIRGFYSGQAQTYTQFRTRTSLDNIAREVRATKGVLTAYDGYAIHSGADITGGETNGACIILQAPAQDSETMGLMYHGAGSETPNAMVTDTIIYRHKPSARTLECTIIPARDVVTSDGATRSSYRAELTNAVVATDLETLRFVFRDRDGAPLAAGNEARTAAVDIVTNVRQERAADASEAYAISGVRLRNMRSGSIPGVVTNAGSPVQNALLLAVYTSNDGAYTPNTVVGRATTDSEGTFEIYGLEPGTYTVNAYSPGESLPHGSVTGVHVPEEESSDPITVSVS